MKQQLVSVIIPTRNRQDSLVRAINSVLEQTYENIEIVIVDDFSDSPISLNKLGVSLGSNLVQLIRNPFRFGGAKSRNVGVAVSRGDFICFLDDDDVFYPNKIKLLKTSLDENQGYSMAFGKIAFNIREKKWIAVRYFNPFSFESNVRVMNLIHTNATLIKREVFEKVTFYECLERYQDLQFHIEASLSYKTLFVNECVAEWNVEDRKGKVTAMGGLTKRRRDTKAFRLLTEHLANVGVNREYLYSYYANLMRLSLMSFDFIGFSIGLRKIILNVDSWRNLQIDRQWRKLVFGLCESN